MSTSGMNMAALEAAAVQGAGRDLHSTTASATNPSRELHDAAMPKIMADPRLDPATLPMPFDGKRMIYGGFDVVVDA